MLERVEADSCGPKLKAALRLVVRGEPYREAAKQAGLASHQDVYRRARALGLTEPHVEEQKSQYREILGLANAEIRYRLVENPEAMSDRDLIVASGVACDKLARLESQPSAAESPLSRLFEMLHRGGKLEIVGPQGSAAIERAEESEPPTIDVMPGSDPQASQ
jgi:hypothetical protein